MAENESGNDAAPAVSSKKKRNSKKKQTENVEVSSESSTVESASENSFDADIETQETVTDSEVASTDQEPVIDETQTTQTVDDEPTLNESQSVSYSDPVQPIVNTFNDYAENMKPGTPVSIKEITRWQMRLRNAVNIMLKIDPQYFSEAMMAVIGIIRENRDGAFSPRMLYRGHPELRVSSSDLVAFQSVLNLLTTSADYNNPRDINEMVDLNVVFRHLNDDEAQNKLTSFYQM